MPLLRHYTVVCDGCAAAHTPQSTASQARREARHAGWRINTNRRGDQDLLCPACRRQRMGIE